MIVIDRVNEGRQQLLEFCYCTWTGLNQYSFILSNVMAQQKSRGQLRGEANVGSGKLQGRYYLIDQQHDCLESIFCCFCEAANQYTVSEADPNFNVASKKGYIKQSSDCLSRAFCVCNRPFQAKLKLFNQDIAVATRGCKCCLEYIPCAQNELVVTNAGGRVLGSLRVGCWCWAGTNFSCSDAKIEIFGQNQQLMFTVEGSYFQKSILLPCFRCCYFPTIEYHIFDNLKLKVGKVNNIYNGVFLQCTSRTSKFGVQFPSKCDQDQKILLTFAVMYLDFLRYDTPFVCGGIR